MHWTLLDTPRSYGSQGIMPNSVQLFFASRLSKAIGKIEMHRAISEYLGHRVKVVGFIVKRTKYTTLFYPRQVARQAINVNLMIFGENTLSGKCFSLPQLPSLGPMKGFLSLHCAIQRLSTSTRTLLLEPQTYKNTVWLGKLGAKVPGHGQEQL